MKHYWINVDESVYRYAFMKQQFDRLGIENSRVSAVTPSDMKGLKILKSLDSKENDVEIAVTLSHIKAIKQGYDDGDEYFIVCEDDIYFPFTINFQKLINELPEDFEIFQMMVLDYDGNKFINSLYKEKKFYTKFDEKKRLFSTGMYLISRKGANKILKLFTNKQTGKYDLRDFICIKQADYVLYLNTNTYTSTFPFCYPTLKFVSQIHPYHYYFHKLAIDVMKEVIYDKNAINPYIAYFNKPDDYDDTLDFYWINLDNAIDRKSFMENQFNKFI